MEAADCRRLVVFARPAPAHAHSQRVATIFPNWRLVSK